MLVVLKVVVRGVDVHSKKITRFTCFVWEIFNQILKK